MFDSETEGSAKGSLKDKLRFLDILIRIAKIKKYNLTFLNANDEKLDKCTKFFLFFYTPVKAVLDEELKTNNTIIYDGLLESEKTTLTRNENMVVVDLEVIKRRKKKRGIGEEIEVKKEISEKHQVPDKEISPSLVNDYVQIKNNSTELFDTEISEEIKEAIIEDRIKADKVVSKLHEIASEEKDLYLGKDIDYMVKENSKLFEKLRKSLEENEKKIRKLSIEIDEYTLKYQSKLDFANLDTLLGGVVGIGIGLLTLPLSFSRTFTFGTNLIRSSLTSINEKVRFNTNIRTSKQYKIDIKDIISAEKALKSSDYLLEDILFRLDNLKYKIKQIEYKIPDVSKKLKEIEAIEKGLTKKKRELKKIVESFEKSKVKVINRKIKNQ